MSHEHTIKKMQISFIEFDDVDFNKISNAAYFGEGNSKGRKMDFTFEYCLDCNLRQLNGKPVMTKGLFDEELEKWVNEAKTGNYVKAKEVTVQHSDYEILERLLENALKLGALKQAQH